MKYIELKFPLDDNPVFTEILIAELAEIGFESFTETESEIQAYIPETDFSKAKLATCQQFNSLVDESKTVITKIQDQNWNEVWESNYEAVIINDQCRVRAPFHEENTKFKFDILLNPKMAFGTAHHETTALMLELLLEEDCEGKKILDMGSGTAVLAILASMKDAAHIDAIDNDDWAYRNAVENVRLNNIENIHAALGDASILPSKPTYNLILANINKNILLQDLPSYCKTLVEGGRLFLSGFYDQDLEDIKAKAVENGLKFVISKEKNKWTAAAFCL